MEIFVVRYMGEFGPVSLEHHNPNRLRAWLRELNYEDLFHNIVRKEV